MDANGIKIFFEGKIAKVKEFAESQEAAYMVGNTAVNFFKKGFINEGFTNNGLHKWKEVKRRQNPKIKGAAASRKILTGKTGDLGRSIKFKNAGKGTIIILGDSPYAAVHNEGLKAGRGKGFIMPKRQFIGESEELNKEIDNKLNLKITKILDEK